MREQVLTAVPTGDQQLQCIELRGNYRGAHVEV
eukprot:IDg20557t1